MSRLAGKNPFADEFDNDDEEFLRRGSRYNTSRGEERYGEGGGATGVGSRQDQLQQLQKESMNRQLESTQRCLASIYDSEAIGVATAEELVRQGEQLDNIESKVEKINADTRVSQRHLNGIKSIFGGLKNWWQGEEKKEQTVATKPPPRDSALRQTLDASQNRPSLDQRSDIHPAMRLRSDDVVGFCDDSDDYTVRGGDSHSQRNVGAMKQSTGRSAEWNEYESSLNKNIDAMSTGLARLKMLGLGLKDEIETQNDQIERIIPKVDRADTKINDQNRQMKKILGK